MVIMVVSHASVLVVTSFQMRDLRSVGAKLQIVLNPRGDQEGVLTKLKDCKLDLARRAATYVFCYSSPNA